ncbi:MAG: flagellar hook capping FlgD N-terminal domain-containing protein [Microbacteriaceae bacterium]
MTIVTPVGASSTAATTASSAAAPSKSLDSEVFLELLVTQLRNQDPSSPMDTNEMMAQTTQLAMMESLTTLQGLTEESFGLQMRSAAASLVGQQVSYLGADGTTVTGLAESISFATSPPSVNVGGKAVALDAISGVAPSTTSTSTDAASGAATA